MSELLVQPEKTAKFQLNLWNKPNTITSWQQLTEDNGKVERFAMHKNTYDPREIGKDAFEAENMTMTGYTKVAEPTAVTAKDSVLLAIGKLESIIGSEEDFVNEQIKSAVDSILYSNEELEGAETVKQALDELATTYSGGAVKLKTPRNINGTPFDGTKDITVPAPRLSTARNINGTPFDGTANITITAAANGGNSATVGGSSVVSGPSRGLKNITSSTGSPSGGSNGDVWLQYE